MEFCFLWSFLVTLMATCFTLYLFKKTVSMSVCVCVCVCACVCVCVCAYTHTHTHTHTGIYIYIQTSNTVLHTCIHICSYTCVCVCVCVCVSVCVCMHTITHTHSHVNTYMSLSSYVSGALRAAAAEKRVHACSARGRGTNTNRKTAKK